MRRSPYPTLIDRYQASSPHGQLSLMQMNQQTLRTRSHIASSRKELFHTKDASGATVWKLKPRVADFSPRRTSSSSVTPSDNRNVVEVN